MLSTKSKNDIIFPGVECINTKFNSAKSALLHIVNYFNNDEILKVSDLLNIDEVKNITSCDVIYKY